MDQIKKVNRVIKQMESEGFNIKVDPRKIKGTNAKEIRREIANKRSTTWTPYISKKEKKTIPISGKVGLDLLEAAKKWEKEYNKLSEEEKKDVPEYKPKNYGAANFSPRAKRYKVATEEEKKSIIKEQTKDARRTIKNMKKGAKRYSSEVEAMRLKNLTRAIKRAMPVETKLRKEIIKKLKEAGPSVLKEIYKKCPGILDSFFNYDVTVLGDLMPMLDLLGIDPETPEDARKKDGRTYRDMIENNEKLFARPKDEKKFIRKSKGV